MSAVSIGELGAAGFFAATFFVAIFLAGAATAGWGADNGSTSAGLLDGAAFFAAAFFTGFTSSGCWALVRPSRSARRRIRSACCSIMVEEWVFAPTPKALERSIISALVIPSSLASSCIRVFFDKTSTAFRGVALNRQTGQRFVSCSCSPSSLRMRIGVLRIPWLRVAVSTPAESHVASLHVVGRPHRRYTTRPHGPQLCG